MQKQFFSVPLSSLLASAVLSWSATGAIAQTTPVLSNPTTVGVTPQDAAEAARKAVPRADTGTLVRTEESAADRARKAVDAAKAEMPKANTTPSSTSTPMTTAPAAVTTPSDSNAAVISNSTATRSKNNLPRRARADRN